MLISNSAFYYIQMIDQVINCSYHLVLSNLFKQLCQVKLTRQRYFFNFLTSFQPLVYLCKCGDTLQRCPPATTTFHVNINPWKFLKSRMNSSSTYKEWHLPVQQVTINSWENNTNQHLFQCFKVKTPAGILIYVKLEQIFSVIFFKFSSIKWWFIQIRVSDKKGRKWLKYKDTFLDWC